ncbi:hypothetical protein [Chelativorans sp.]|nr:hypothetical protein [Chelativorans sp.]
MPSLIMAGLARAVSAEHQPRDLPLLFEITEAGRLALDKKEGDTP